MKAVDISPLREAQARSRQFENKDEIQQCESDMSLSQNVRKIVEFIMQSKLRSYEKEKIFRKRFPNFAESMPKLFEMVIRDDLTEYHRQIIEMMLSTSEKLLDKKELEVLDADKIVFNKLREDYIDPIVKPDKEKIAEFMNKKEYTKEELHGGAHLNVDVRK